MASSLNLPSDPDLHAPLIMLSYINAHGISEREAVPLVFSRLHSSIHSSLCHCLWVDQHTYASYIKTLTSKSEALLALVVVPALLACASDPDAELLLRVVEETRRLVSLLYAAAHPRAACRVLGACSRLLLQASRRLQCVFERSLCGPQAAVLRRCVRCVSGLAAAVLVHGTPGPEVFSHFKCVLVGPVSIVDLEHFDELLSRFQRFCAGPPTPRIRAQKRRIRPVFWDIVSGFGSVQLEWCTQTQAASYVQRLLGVFSAVYNENAVLAPRRPEAPLSPVAYAIAPPSPRGDRLSAAGGARAAPPRPFSAPPPRVFQPPAAIFPAWATTRARAPPA